MNIKIRKGTVDDNKDIFELNKDCLPIYYSMLEHFLMLVSKDYLVLVAEYQKKIVGYIICKINDKVNLHILTFGVVEKYRNKNIGSTLIVELVKYSEQYNFISLYVHEENVNAIKFYEKNGFEKESKIDNYYEGQLEANSQNAFKMIKKLGEIQK